MGNLSKVESGVKCSPCPAQNCVSPRYQVRAEEKVEERQGNSEEQLQRVVNHTWLGVSRRAPMDILRDGRKWGGGRSDVGGVQEDGSG